MPPLQLFVIRTSKARHIEFLLRVAFKSVLRSLQMDAQAQLFEKGEVQQTVAIDVNQYRSWQANRAVNQRRLFKDSGALIGNK